MRHMYLVECIYKSPDMQKRGQFANLLLETEKEAVGYCDHHNSDTQFWCWSKVAVGKFKKRKPKVSTKLPCYGCGAEVGERCKKSCGPGGRKS